MKIRTPSCSVLHADLHPLHAAKRARRTDDRRVKELYDGAGPDDPAVIYITIFPDRLINWARQAATVLLPQQLLFY